MVARTVMNVNMLPDLSYDKHSSPLSINDNKEPNEMNETFESDIRSFVSKLHTNCNDSNGNSMDQSTFDSFENDSLEEVQRDDSEISMDLAETSHLLKCDTDKITNSSRVNVYFQKVGDSCAINNRDCSTGECKRNETLSMGCSTMECLQNETLSVETHVKSNPDGMESPTVENCSEDLNLGLTKNVALSPNSYQNSESSSAENYNSNKSKVVVRVLPTSDIDFGSISALQDHPENNSVTKNIPGNIRRLFLSNHNERQSLSSDGKKVCYSTETKSSDIDTSVARLQSTYSGSKSSTYIFQRYLRKKRAFNFCVSRGKGTRLEDIEFVSANLKGASVRLLRILHYILFGTYGQCKNEYLLSRTKQNILHFSGFPFNSNSESFRKKRNCLLRIPYPLLCDMYNILIGKGCKSRPEIVEHLLQFFKKPERIVSHKGKWMKRNKAFSKQKYPDLDHLDLKGFSPIVLVEKLSTSYIEKMVNKVPLETVVEYKTADFHSDPVKYFKPAYILNGPGQKLKAFSGIVKRVLNAQRRIINILHNILYGRAENDEISRRNILEFSGFSKCQKEFASERTNILSSLKHIELKYICDILLLQAQVTSPKNKKIQKIMQFLHMPSCKVRRRVAAKKHMQTVECSRLPKLSKVQAVECDSLTKLRDFKNICFNIECAAPADLSELNDLLFVKPCDDSEIHEKILEFTRFTFDENTFDYHYRKTLMHYMSFCVIRKIAQLLAIPDWEGYSNQHDLSSTILKFLMDMQTPAKAFKKVDHSTSVSCNHSKTSTPPTHARTTKPQIIRLYQEKTEKSWNCHKNVKSSSENMKSPIPDTYSSHVEESLHSIMKKTSEQRETIVIHKSSESSFLQSCSGRNGFLSRPMCHLEDSIPLRDMLHHPSDDELEQVIGDIVRTKLWSITMGDLLKEVFGAFPEFDLLYREDFIRRKAKEVLSGLRRNALDSLKIVFQQGNDF